MRTSVRTIISLLRELRTLEFQRVYPHAQTAFMIAKTMGGHEGDIDAFIPAWAKPPAAGRTVLVSRAVDASVRRALTLGLVSQDMLDELTLAGFDA